MKPDRPRRPRNAVIALVLACVPWVAAADPLGITNVVDGRSTFSYLEPIPNVLGTTHTIVLEWLYAEATRGPVGTTELLLVSSPTVPIDSYGNSKEPIAGYGQFPPGVELGISSRDGARAATTLQGEHVYGSATKVRPTSEDTDYIDGHRYRFVLTVAIPSSASASTALTLRVFDLGPETAPFAQPEDVTPRDIYGAIVIDLSSPAPELASRSQLHLRITHRRGSGIAAFRALTVNGQAWDVPEILGNEELLNPFYIVQQPPPVHTAIVGEDVELSVLAAGSQGLSYQWQRRPIGSPDYYDLGAVRGPTYTIENVRVDASGDYRVKLTGNGATIYTEPTSLSVYAPESASAEPEGEFTREQGTAFDSTLEQFVPAESTSFTYRRPIVSGPGANHTIELEWVAETSTMRPQTLGTYMAIVSSPNPELDATTQKPAEPALGFPSYFAPWASFYVNHFGDANMAMTMSDGYPVAPLYTGVGEFRDGHQYRARMTLRLADDVSDPVALSFQVWDLGPENSLYATPVMISANFGLDDPTTGRRPQLASLSRLHLRIWHWNRDGAEYRSLRVNGEAWPIPTWFQQDYVPAAPVIVGPPLDQQVVEGATAMFRVSAFGAGPLHYQWRRGGTAIAGATSAELVLTGVSVAATGEYDVVVSNATGTPQSVTSRAAALRLNPAPTIDALSEPRQVINPGDRLDLSVSASGAGTLSYQWFKNGVAIPGATDADYHVPATSHVDRGAYWVEVADSEGARVSRSIHVYMASHMTRVVSWGATSGPRLNVPAGLDDAIQVRVGNAFSLALRSDGKVAGWGDPTRGELSLVPQLANVVAISAGYQHAIALLEDGTVRAWGANESGQATVPSGLSDVVAVCASTSTSFAVRRDGTVVGWGYLTGIEVPPNVGDIVAMDAQGNHVVALRRDGKVVAWGKNDDGQCDVPIDLDQVVAVAAGEAFSLALKSDGTVVGWGRNDYGQSTPPEDLSDVIAIDAAPFSALALKADGTVVAWGSPHFPGQPPPANLQHVTDIAAGNSLGLAITRVASLDPATPVVTAGAPVTFSIETEGSGPVTYQWQFNGNDIPGATAASYTVRSAQRFHAGSYQVIVRENGTEIQRASGTLTVDPAPPSDSRLLNLSTRGLAQSGDNVLIPGFVISGPQRKRLLLRAVGPTLSKDPFTLMPQQVAPDPRMTLKRLNTSVAPAVYVDVATNDNWGDNTNAAAITTTAASVYAFGIKDPREAALLLDLEPGQYTLVAGDRNGEDGIAIVELYDADPDGLEEASRLVNISNRGFCGVGDNVMIPGFWVSNEGPQTFLIRVVGPRLAQDPFGVTGTMADPQLALFRSGEKEPMFTNDNWSDNPDADYTAQIAQQVYAFSLKAGSKDAALVVTLPPGGYTVVGSSAVGGDTGVVLVEVYLVR